jgi:predicted HD phosphohydrolase
MAIYTRVPRKRGLPAIHQLIKTVCRLMTKYMVVIKAILPEAQHVYVDALEQACNDFTQFVGNPDAGDLVP